MTSSLLEQLAEQLEQLEQLAEQLEQLAEQLEQLEQLAEQFEQLAEQFEQLQVFKSFCVHCALQACRNLGIRHDGIRHEYAMEYAMTWRNGIAAMG